MRVCSSPLLLVILAPLLSGPASLEARELAYYLPAVEYDPKVPTPRESLGFDVGVRHVEHHQLTAYMHALAAASPRVALQQTGRSHAGKPLLMLTITSPKNHRRLESLRKLHLGLTNRTPTNDQDLRDLPAVMTMGHSVHGDEPSGSNAALLVGYYLAAARDKQVDEFLDNLIILFDPCLNPDGFDRFAQWANAMRGRQLNDSPDHAEHNQPWPGGRVNYYWFDLNRDWLPAQHPESQARLKVYQQWKPNVVLDFHEMGGSSTFFFQPGVPARANPLIPGENIRLTERFAAYHSQALDQLGSLYFTEERFDDFYFGKGSTYPDIHGGVGILFEQASSRGHVQRTAQGRLTFPFTIRNQVAVSFSSLRAATAMRVDLLKYQRDFYQEGWANAGQSTGEGELRTVQHVFSTEADSARLAAFADVLRSHDIRFWWLQEDVEQDQRLLRAGHAIVVPAQQRESRLLQALMQQETSFRENIFYDVSAWSLQLAFDVRHDALQTPLPARLLKRQRPRPPELEPAPQTLAYVLDSRNYHAPRFAYQLLRKGCDVRVAHQEFTAVVAGRPREFSRGSLLVPLGVQPGRRSEIERVVRDAVKASVPVAALSSGLTPAGPDLGSGSFDILRKPRVVVAIGDSVSRGQAGEIWHLLDTRVQMPTTLVEAAAIGGLEWDDVNVLVLPGGAYRDVSTTVRQRISNWISDGGTLIALGSAIQWTRDAELASPEIASGAEVRRAAVLPYADAVANRALNLISGAIFEADVDATHPLCYGLSNKLPVFRDSRIVLRISSDPYNNPVRYTEKPLLSGYCSEENQRSLQGKPSVQVHTRGRGRIILLTDNPNFRAFWYGTNRLFTNAIFLGQTVR